MHRLGGKMKTLAIAAFVGTTLVSASAALAQGEADGARTEADYARMLGVELSPETEGEETLPAGRLKGFSLERRPLTTQSAAPPRHTPKPTRTTVSVAPGPKPGKRTIATAPRQPVVRPAAQQRGNLSLTFEVGSAVLTGQARANAAQFAALLKRPQLAGRTVLIEGHTDRQGSREFNIDLSLRRAQAVADFLQSRGVPAERLRVKGYGFDKPVSASAARNRRVEAVLDS
ncbi:MAG TPA: OmpA family protein [Allosphingosinicella sp.]|jgi:outer membrane protein OmpA-like peptidoglycan-associated protein